MEPVAYFALGISAVFALAGVYIAWSNHKAHKRDGD